MFSLAAFSQANWSSHPDNGRTMPLHITMMPDGPVGVKVGLQGITVQPTMGAERAAVAVATREAVYCANMMEKLEFGETSKHIPLHTDTTSALNMTGNLTLPLAS